MNDIAFFDVDNVLIKGQSQQMLATYFFRKKKIKLFLLIKVYLWFILYKLHLVKDVIAIRNRSFSVFKGWSFDGSRELFDDFFETLIVPIISDRIAEKTKEHIKSGDEVVLLSASLNEIVHRLRDHLGVKHSISTCLDVAAGKYTGKISGMVPYGDNKLLAMKDFLSKNNHEGKKCFVYADHSSDKAILEFATDPAVVNPDKKLKELAIKKNWPIYDI